jgi:hypothetical protein
MFRSWPIWTANACVAILWWMQLSLRSDGRYDVAEILLQPSHTASLLVAAPYLMLHCFVPLDRQIRDSRGLPVQLLINLSCVRSRGCVIVRGTFCQIRDSRVQLFTKKNYVWKCYYILLCAPFLCVTCLSPVFCPLFLYIFLHFLFQSFHMLLHFSL